MSCFRSKLFLVIVSLFVLTGYGCELFGECCSHEPSTQIEQGHTGPAKDSEKDHGCQCVCHQAVTPLAFEPVGLTDTLPLANDLLVLPNEIPPDAVPLGIEYPPQLS